MRRVQQHHESPREPRARTTRNVGGVAARAFTALAENVRDYAIFLMDPDGVIIFWGEGARLIKWWTKEQAEGSHLRLLYPSGGSEDGTAEEHLRMAAEHGEYTGEGQRVRSDGSTFWAGVTLTALWDDEGTLLGFAKVTRDLTARRAADALLQASATSAEAARADAVAASAAKSGFLATISHEIRTPLNAILGYHDLLDLEIDGPLTEGQRKHLSRARASGRHLLGLVSEVLDFSRIDAERAPVGRASFRLGDAVAGALELVMPQARGANLTISNAVSGYAAGLAAWGDEQRVRQILTNLLANAVKFTSPEQTHRGRITISAGTASQPPSDTKLVGEGPWIYIRVEDTGRGIPSDQLRSVFEPFVQADMSLTREHGGTGLGLAISRRLAHLMGGDLTVRSDVGVGSTFFLWLLAAPAESLNSGGLEGHGPNSTDRDRRGHEQRAQATEMMEGEQASRTLVWLSNAILGELERVLDAFVVRVKHDSEMRTARTVAPALIEDHLASFLADVASTLATVDLTANRPTESVVDGSVIQRLVAERHGMQRARLGWKEPELSREFQILREELGDAVRRRMPRSAATPSREGSAGEAERAVEFLDSAVRLAEGVSRESYLRTVAEIAPGGASK
ncbi:MAG TPA: ATP-binding protein [Gemmatimonadaceae bacterium]|nr:ATP-binding protein [Gemmatimonadaceae bacterium]